MPVSISFISDLFLVDIILAAKLFSNKFQNLKSLFSLFLFFMRDF